MNDERIALAEASLRDFLGCNRLEGRSFLDVGSGSGLFSLAARRLGARVHSFDFDPQSVACTIELRRRYFKDDPCWLIERGSILDTAYLGRLGHFDIIYSWGVLHHTGAMAEALANIKRLVPIGGQLFIAIYNDQSAITDEWWRIKRRYNALPRVLRLPYALNIIARNEWPLFHARWQEDDLKGYLRGWREYHKITARGMNKWHDWIDWIGGYPYERATVDEIADLFMNDGFEPTKIFYCAGYGCNEFVFRRVVGAGTVVDRLLPESGWYVRRHGVRVTYNSRQDSTQTGSVSKMPMLERNEQLLLFAGQDLVGPVTPEPQAGSRAVMIRWRQGAIAGKAAELRVAPGVCVRLDGPFQHVRGHMWRVSLPQLEAHADRIEELGSGLVLFENGRQLQSPHSPHDQIARYGAGRFSHWRDTLYFSTPDNQAPDPAGRRYEIVYRTSGA